MCERVIEAVGKQWPLDLAGELVGFGGRLVIAGYHRTARAKSTCRYGTGRASTWSTRTSATQRCALQGAARGGGGGRRAGSTRRRSTPTRYPLERIGEALDATRDKPDGFVKALVNRYGQAPRRLPRHRLDRPPPHGSDARHRCDRGGSDLRSLPRDAAEARKLAPDARSSSRLRRCLRWTSTAW